MNKALNQGELRTKARTRNHLKNEVGGHQGATGSYVEVDAAIGIRSSTNCMPQQTVVWRPRLSKHDQERLLEDTALSRSLVIRKLSPSLVRSEKRKTERIPRQAL